jgi:hypothetical protein
MTPIEEAYEHYGSTGRILDSVRMERRLAHLPLDERPSEDELVRAEEEYARAAREFHALGGYEELHRDPDRHEDMYGSGWEGYEE